MPSLSETARRRAISAWKLELTNALPAFDYESMSDVVIGLRYTARDGGETLKQGCLDDIMDALSVMTAGSGATGLMQTFSVRHEFSDAWYRFVNPTADASSQTLELPIDKTYFPYRFQGSDIQIKNGLTLPAAEAGRGPRSDGGQPEPQSHERRERHCRLDPRARARGVQVCAGTRSRATW